MDISVGAMPVPQAMAYALLAGLVGGYPVTGGFSRRAVNADAGARTKSAAIVSAGILILVIVALTPLL